MKSYIDKFFVKYSTTVLSITLFYSIIDVYFTGQKDYGVVVQEEDLTSQRLKKSEAMLTPLWDSGALV